MSLATVSWVGCVAFRSVQTHCSTLDHTCDRLHAIGRLSQGGVAFVSILITLRTRK